MRMKNCWKNRKPEIQDDRLYAKIAAEFLLESAD
jgi:hypothetical protein